MNKHLFNIIGSWFFKSPISYQVTNPHFQNIKYQIEKYISNLFKWQYDIHYLNTGKKLYIVLGTIFLTLGKGAPKLCSLIQIEILYISKKIFSQSKTIKWDDPPILFLGLCTGTQLKILKSKAILSSLILPHTHKIKP